MTTKTMEALFMLNIIAQLCELKKSLLGPLEVQADGIQAKAFAGLRRPVGKNMPQMRTAPGTSDFRATHTERVVLFVFHRAGKRLLKRWPAGAGIEFRIRRKKRVAAG